MTLPRIAIPGNPPEGFPDDATEDAHNAAVNDLIRAEALGHIRRPDIGGTTAILELERPGEDWNKTGDAVEVDIATGNIRTLSHDEWIAAGGVVA